MCLCLGLGHISRLHIVHMVHIVTYLHRVTLGLTNRHLTDLCSATPVLNFRIPTFMPEPYAKSASLCKQNSLSRKWGRIPTCHYLSIPPTWTFHAQQGRYLRHDQLAPHRDQV